MTLITLERKAQTLWNVEKEIADIEADLKERTKKLEAKREKLRTELLTSLQDARVKSIKVESGDVFVRSYKIKYNITDEDKAVKWAMKNHCMRIDKTEANKILHHTITTPDGFDRVEEEFLTVRRNYQDND